MCSAALGSQDCLSSFTTISVGFFPDTLCLGHYCLSFLDFSSAVSCFVIFGCRLCFAMQFPKRICKLLDTNHPQICGDMKLRKPPKGRCVPLLFSPVKPVAAGYVELCETRGNVIRNSATFI